MSQIHDFGCMVDDCEHDAAELIQTDDDELVLLCRGHASIRDGWYYIALDIGGRTLMQDTAGSWFYMPEKPVMGGDV